LRRKEAGKLQETVRMNWHTHEEPLNQASEACGELKDQWFGLPALDGRFCTVRGHRCCQHAAVRPIVSRGTEFLFGRSSTMLTTCRVGNERIYRYFSRHTPIVQDHGEWPTSIRRSTAWAPPKSFAQPAGALQSPRRIGADRPVKPLLDPASRRCHRASTRIIPPAMNEPAAVRSDVNLRNIGFFTRCLFGPDSRLFDREPPALLRRFDEDEAKPLVASAGTNRDSGFIASGLRRTAARGQSSVFACSAPAGGLPGGLPALMDDGRLDRSRRVAARPLSSRGLCLWPASAKKKASRMIRRQPLSTVEAMVQT